MPRLRTSDLTAIEIKDALWLAAIIREHAETTAPAKSPGNLDLPAVDPAATAPPERPEPPAPQQDLDIGMSWSTRSGDGALARPAGQAGGAGKELSHAANLARALRPLMKRSPSPWKQQVNEEATAIRAAQDGMWLPVWEPEPWRRFEVVIVVDSAPSMDVWRETVAEFRELLRQQGAFRNVRTLLLDCSARELTLRVEGPAGAVHSTRHLIDPTGRRLVLVMTDAIANGWRDGSAEGVLARWANRMPLAVINVLPSRLWSWGGLAPHRVCLSSGVLGVANRDLRVRQIEHDIFDEMTVDDAVPVPVLALTPEWLAGWASLFAASGAASVETTAIMLDPRAGKRLLEPAEPDGARSAFDRVMRFRTYASVPAFQLAGLLAAAPLNLAMMRFVQRELLPDSDVSALAEVLLGGLLRKVKTTRSVHDPTAVVFEFHDGVREELLSGVRRADTVRVARVLGDYLGSSVAILRNFRDAVDDPDGTAQPELTAETVPYLRVQEAVFRALSGRYAPRAVSLRRELNVSRRGERARLWVHARRGGSHEVVPVEPGAEHVVDPPSPESDHRSQVWGRIPVRNADFVGRESLLRDIAEKLADRGVTAVLPEALQGMGGVGKTQTVVEYIYRHADEYNVIWWIPAEQMSQMTASFVELAGRLGLPASSAEVAIAEVLESLRTGKPHRRWLLVFDNAGDPATVEPFLPTGAGHIVVTSRDSRWARVANVVEVDLFTREESIEMLRRLGGDIGEADADRLADALGDLPLAVEQAAIWRVHTGMPAAEYLTLLRKHLARLPEDEPGEYGMTRSVAAAWSVPLHHLRTEFPAALHLLRACAYFGPEPIPQSYFTPVGMPIPAELAQALADPVELDRTVQRISDYGLAKVDHRRKTLQLHRLVLAVLKNQLSPSDKDDMRHAAHVLLAQANPADPGAPRSWPRYAELLPHVIMSEAMRCRKDDRVRVLLINVVMYLLSCGDYQGAADLAQQIVFEWRDGLGGTHADTLEMSRLRGRALYRLGRYDESYQLNLQIYQAVRDTYGDGNLLFLRTANSLRMSLRSRGSFVEELQMQQNIFERSCHVLGRDHPNTLEYANNLAGCLRLNGEFFKARQLDEDTLRRKKSVLGEDHPDTFLTANALAMDMRECGEHIQACRIQEKNLAEQRVVVGDEHPRTIGAMRNLAVARRKAGFYAAAADLSQACVRMYRRRHGARHLDTFTAQMCLSADLRQLGRLPESRKLGELSHRLFVERYGEKHPYTLVAAINLAVTLRLMGMVDAARNQDEQTLTVLREIFDSDHPFSLVAATNLASDFAALGAVHTACEMDQDTLERSTRTLGEKHPSTLSVALNLAIDLDRLNRYGEATELHDRTVADLKQVLGIDHPATMYAMSWTRANCDTDTMQF